MNSNELRRFLAGSAMRLETLVWLQKKFLPTVTDILNQRDSRKRLALYSGDRIPENERNLTDFRNRVSLIVEYEFARVISRIMRQSNIHDLFCAYVVANRFPDLEVRSDGGELGLRFEVKCLQSTAEEKSANFSTLRKDIQPNTDFIIVFLWDWSAKESKTRWDRAPYVLDVYAFNAYALATLRDWYWLNRPPSNLGEGYQGFDIRFAVNCVDDKYNEEEGNFGKLLRLWQRKFAHKPRFNTILRKTESDYLSFKDGVVAKGFKTLAHQILPELSGEPRVSGFRDVKHRLGFKSVNMGFLLGSRMRLGHLETVMKGNDLNELWVFRDKYQWHHYRRSTSDVELIGSGNKPKTLIANRLGG